MSSRNKKKSQKAPPEPPAPPKPFYEPPEWCTSKKVAEFASQIAFMRENSDIVTELHAEAKSLNCQIRETDVDKFILKTIKMIGGSTKNRFAPPATVWTFNSIESEVAANIWFKNDEKYKSYVEGRERYKEKIRRECFIDMRINNPPFDWGFMGLRNARKTNAFRFARGKTPLLDEKYAKMAFETVEKFIESRNETMAKAKEVEIENKGKFINVNEVTFEFLMHMSNYFDVMFEYFLPVLMEHKQEAYREYSEYVFRAEDLLEIDRKEEFLRARVKIRYNDGWQVYEDDQDLFQMRFKYFLDQSNVKSLVDRAIKHAENPDQYKNWDWARETLTRKVYNQWVNDVLVAPFTDLKFRKKLTFEIFFTNSNFCDILRSTLTNFDEKMPKSVWIELAARRYFNAKIAGNKKWVCNIKFRDGTKIEDYNLPSKEDRVLEFTDEMMSVQYAFLEVPEENREKPGPACSKLAKKVIFVDDNDENVAIEISLEDKMSEIDLLTPTESISRAETKTTYPTPNEILGGSPFKHGPPVSCAPSIVQKVTNWHEKCSNIELSQGPVSGSQLQEEFPPPELDVSDKDANIECSNTEEMATITVSQNPEEQSVEMDLLQNFVPESQSTLNENTLVKNNETRQEERIAMVQIHTQGRELIVSQGSFRQNPCDPVFAVQGSNELTAVNRTLGGISVNIEQTPERLFDGMVEMDINEQPILQTSTLEAPLLTSSQIKQEHDTQYSQYSQVVEIVPTPNEIIEIEEDEEENMFADLLNQNPSSQVEPDGGSPLDDLTPETPSTPSQPVSIPVATSSKTPKNPVFKRPSPKDRPLPMKPSALYHQWKGTPRQSQSNDIDETFSDDDSQTKPLRSGKSTSKNPNLLSQNNSLFYSSQVTRLLEQPQASSSTSTVVAAPTNRTTYTFLPIFYLNSLNFKIEGDSQRISAKIRIPVERDLVEITDMNSIRLLFDMNEDEFSSVETLLRPEFVYTAGNSSRGTDTRSIVLNTFFTRLSRGHTPSSCISLLRIFGPNDEMVEAKIVLTPNDPQPEQSHAEAFDPVVFKALRM
ncbi:uncharacterized protein LOC134828084 [Culicoides brevitarsis]|uniref:uncharacterized protein LOC134828084 n=1 Tax=Culicoides brevitarsis TaxID=469753 RepID=UPI00307C50B8